MPPRDRIKAIRVVKASEIIPNPQNWRTHPDAQRDEMSKILDNIGNVDILKVVETDAGYMLVDGHLRQELLGTARVKVAVLDLDELETMQVLESFNRISSMAITDDNKLNELLKELSMYPEPDVNAEDIGAVLLSVALEPEQEVNAIQQAQDAMNRIVAHLQVLFDVNPEAFCNSKVIVIPPDGHCDLLVMVDPDLADIIIELKTRALSGEKHPLDKLFEAIWHK